VGNVEFFQSDGSRQAWREAWTLSSRRDTYGVYQFATYNCRVVNGNKAVDDLGRDRKMEIARCYRTVRTLCSVHPHWRRSVHTCGHWRGSWVLDTVIRFPRSEESGRKGGKPFHPPMEMPPIDWRVGPMHPDLIQPLPTIGGTNRASPLFAGRRKSKSHPSCACRTCSANNRM